MPGIALKKRMHKKKGEEKKDTMSRYLFTILQSNFNLFPILIDDFLCFIFITVHI